MKLLIFDASNYIFRAFFASPPMNNSAGFPTNGLHFYTTMILSVIRRIHPDAIALAYEKRGKKFRHTLYPEYKGQREAPPEALQMQFPYFRQITDAMGLRAYDADGYEADDVIATLTRQAHDRGWSVVIASSDKDLMQLIEKDGSVILLDAMAKSTSKTYHAITYEDVIERFQVEPSKVADVLALAGDTIDNIPGCKGIGEKTAGKLISEFGSLEALMERRGEIKRPAQKANLEAFAPHAELSKKLTSLVYDVPIELNLEPLQPNKAQLVYLFSALELHRLLLDILGPDVHPDLTVPRIQSEGTSESVRMANNTMPTSQTETDISLIRPLVSCSIVKNGKEFDQFYNSIGHGTVGVAPLWLSENPHDRHVLGVSLASQHGCIYLSLAHARTLFGDDPLSSELRVKFIQFLKDETIQKAVYGLKPIIQFGLRSELVFPVSSFIDVEIASYLIHPERPQSLEESVLEYLGTKLELNPSNWLGTGKKAISVTSVSSTEGAEVSGVWAQYIQQLSEKLPPELARHGLDKVYRDVDLPLSEILAKMEYDGVGVDVRELSKLSSTFDQELRRLDAEVHSYGDEPFNINSTKELAHFLFETLGIVPGTRKNRQHGLSTDQETLESIDHPIARLILDYRVLSKLRSGYTDSLVNLADPVTHRIHGKFNACVTATTRLSSSDPNLQNIPSRAEVGRQIKRAFVPRDGWSFVGADYSQIELRLMAAFSKEPMLCQAYRDGEDVHARTASLLFDVPIGEVTKSQRQLAKTINFGLLYGMGVQKLARETGYPRAEAKSFLEKFHAQFPTLSSFFDGQIEIARQKGETRTILGHRRPVPELYSSRPMDKAFGERVALNAPIQGSASDVVKCAMIRLDKALKAHQLKGRLLIQVHDELLLECPDDEVEEMSKLLVESMENAIDIGIPLRVELKVGKTWADMK